MNYLNTSKISIETFVRFSFECQPNLKMLSAGVVCCNFLLSTDAFNLPANSLDPDHPAIWSSLICVHTVCCRGFQNIKADDKVDK